MARPVAVTEADDGSPATKAPVGDMVAKALSLLDLLGEYPHGGSLSDLSARSGFPLSTTHRLLASLIRGGYASAADSDRRYHLGLRVFALGQQVASARGFAGTVLPQMEWLAEQTDEAVLMSVLDGDQPALRALRLRAAAGRGDRRTRPARAVALHRDGQGAGRLRPGRSIPPARRDGRPHPTGTAHHHRPGAFRAEIEAVRTSGYAIADEEHEAGIRAIGLPVIDSGDRLRAAISVAAPAYRCDVEQLKEFLPAMRTAAGTIRTLLPSD